MSDSSSDSVEQKDGEKIDGGMDGQTEEYCYISILLFFFFLHPAVVNFNSTSLLHGEV